MCKKILANGIKTLHLYTLNMEKSALAILMVGFLFHKVWCSQNFFSDLLNLV